MFPVVEGGIVVPDALFGLIEFVEVLLACSVFLFGILLPIVMIYGISSRVEDTNRRVKNVEQLVVGWFNESHEDDEAETVDK